MRPRHPTFLERTFVALSGVLILKVALVTVLNDQAYFPPDFTSDFLRGRERYFFGAYQWAFSAHVVSGPVVLVTGLILVSERARRRFPRGHRSLGRFHVACVLLLVTPSGLYMASHAAAGRVAGIGLAALAVATATFVSLGTVSASARRFADHRRWMWRAYILLCSAVVLRLIGGLATVTGATSAWVDPLATWASRLVPLSVFEVREWAGRKSRPPTPERPRARVAQGRRDATVP